MQFDLLSWGIGIPTGIGVNWLSIWLYNMWRRKHTGGDYFTVTISRGTMDFDGSVKTHVSAEELAEKLFKSVKSEPEVELDLHMEGGDEDGKKEVSF